MGRPHAGKLDFEIRSAVSMRHSPVDELDVWFIRSDEVWDGRAMKTPRARPFISGTLY